MSLVAYGSSGEESDSNDSEDVQDTGDFTDISRMSGIETGKKDDQSEIKGAQIATEESLPMEETFPTQEAFPAKGRGLVLPSPKKSTKDEAKSSTYTDKRTTLSSFLPKPKNTDSTERKKDSSLEGKPPLSFGSAESEDEIIDIEEEYVPLAQRPGKTTVKKADDNKPKSVGSLFSLLPPPWQSDKTWLKREEFVKGTNTKSSADHKKAKQPVKISIPTAPQLDSDEEEESSDEPAAKKMRPAKGGAGLKSLLPKPKHSITTKADNPNKPAVKLQSRPLIPYTLTRKPSKEEKSVKKPQKNKQTDEAGSDDEDEPVSFFTFHDKSSITPADVREEMKPMDLSANTIRSNANVKASSSEALNPFASSVAHSVSSPTTTISHGVGKQDVAVDFPKSEAASSQAPSGSEGSYEAGELETRTYFYEQQSGQTQGNLQLIIYNYDTSGSTVTDPYYGHDQETYTYTYPTGAEQTQNQPQETNIDMEKLHKLQGRKKRREEINIVDVNADDQIGDAAVQLTKITTEEIAHRPSRKKSDMPTSQQRRKHQITYLAFQAKERELELRQQWSANSQTRRHTQSKYGF